MITVYPFTAINNKVKKKQNKKDSYKEDNTKQTKPITIQYFPLGI